MPIQLKRGLEADLITENLMEAEPAYTLDTKRLLIGDGEGGVTSIPTAPEVTASANAAITARFASQADAEAGTNNTDIMTSLRTFEQLQIKTSAIAPSISGNSTTRDLTVPAGANPNRMTILLSSATSASAAIRLRVGTGTYYNIVMPTGTGTDNLLALKAGVPYDLALANIGGTNRWVAVGQKAQILYDNAVGTSATFSLSANPANYDYLDFFVELTGDYKWVVRVRASDTRYMIQTTFTSPTAESIYHEGEVVALNRSGTSLTFGANARLEVTQGSANFSRTDNSGIKITRVVAGIY